MPPNKRDLAIQIVDAVIERVVQGESMAAICLEPGMPTRSTMYRWIERLRPDFCSKCSRLGRVVDTTVSTQSTLSTSVSTPVSTVDAVDKRKAAQRDWARRKRARDRAARAELAGVTLAEAGHP